MIRLMSVAAYLLIFLSVPAYAGGPGHQEPAANPTERLLISSPDSEDVHEFSVEVVSTPRLLKQGLMYRKEMDEDAGMLFVFPESKPRAFWMKNTYIPLDIYFIREDGTIRYIYENAQPLDETPIPSYGNALAVLEVNAGVTEKLGIRPGYIIHHDTFGNNLAR